MTQLYIDDELLSLCVPRAEQLMLAEIPPEQTLQHHFSRHFRRKMRALCRYERRSPRMSQFVHCAKTAAAACAVIIVVLMSAVMSVEAARTKIFEFFIQKFEELTSLKIYGNGGLGYVKFEPQSPSYVPDGYKKVNEITDEMTNVIVYVNENDEHIVYSQDLLTASEHIFDTEDADTEDLYLDNQHVTLSKKKGTKRHMIFWHDKKYMYWISGNNITDMELKKMAKSIIVN